MLKEKSTIKLCGELVLRKVECRRNRMVRMKLDRGLKSLVPVILLLLLLPVDSCRTEIRLLMSVFRHGDRYPMDPRLTRLFYPRNPHANRSWFPDSPEHLTIAGKRSAFELGNILREKYGAWLGATYSQKLVDFRSSHPLRCTVTATLVAAALFPPNDAQIWNPMLNWQPIPVLPARLKDNVLFLGGVLCMNYNAKYLQTMLTDREIVAYNMRMRDFYAFVSRNTGAPVSNRVLFYLYMEFLALVSGGLEPPDWTDGIFPHGNLSEGAIMEYRLSSWNNDLKRLTGGVWLKEWFDNVDNYLRDETKTKDGVKKKASFYGGHDLNVAGIMITLGIYYPHVPNYASAINFELHEDDNRRFYVKVLHRDTEEKFTERLVPGCGRQILCPLDTFKSLFDDVTPQNLTEECGAHIGNLIVP